MLKVQNVPISKRLNIRQTILIFGILGCTVGLVLDYLYVYTPIVESKRLLLAADQTEYLARKLELTAAACAADPYSVEMKEYQWRLLVAAWRQRRETRENTGNTVNTVNTATSLQDRLRSEMLQAESDMIRLSPCSATKRLLSGHQMERLFDETHDVSFLELAIRRYQEAVQLYPNHSKTHTALAIALRKAGRMTEAAEPATRALRLDSQMPHLEQKLSEDMRHRLHTAAREKMTFWRISPKRKRGVLSVEPRAYAWG